LLQVSGRHAFSILEARIEAFVANNDPLSDFLPV
jgi:hypothetical protein